MTKINKLERLAAASKWHQSNDPNGSYDELRMQYLRCELTVEEWRDYMIQCFEEVRDEQLDSTDYNGRGEIRLWIEALSW